MDIQWWAIRKMSLSESALAAPEDPNGENMFIIHTDDEEEIIPAHALAIANYDVGLDVDKSIEAMEELLPVDDNAMG
jgi:hypothetical protein